MPASDEQRLKTAQRRAKNLEMRLAGARWEQIAEALEYASKAAACKDFTRALEQTRSVVAMRVGELKEIELLRLDRLQAGVWPKAVRGDVKAADVALKVHDRRVRLLDLTGAQKTVDNAVDAWVEHLRSGGLDPEDQAALDAVTTPTTAAA